MSRYIATRAIRGSNALVVEAEAMLHKALAEKGGAFKYITLDGEPSVKEVTAELISKL